MKTLFISIFALFSICSYAQSNNDDWVYVGKTNAGVIWYVKDANISNSIYTDWDYDCWVKTVNPSPNPISFTIANLKLYCNPKKFKTISYVHYNDKGNVIEASGDLIRTPERAYPNSIIESVIKHVCPKPMD
ncbi:hypothetical protein PFY12_04590 [Chryseobacterium camelliae]|uniref:Uncharacterized protein n=1 Tax=Chryseobacterium camelliae TaxID=1265445 RepID=A0ABY7QRF6_9FLAO|nr:hypothetical protein [Chryseobacterium camelliae]WBV61403.1 hypothetical protein PFY12_04590 [Chryseobacterium camelliae]